jgi:AcrR family transcriptional regulator
MQSYSAIRDQNQEALRRSVVAAADQLLIAQGAGAVTVRRVAQQLDCSTTVIYNLFGSKDGLANALYVRGCELMHAALAAVTPDADPMRYLPALAWAYWDFAQRNPHYYTLMFSGALPDFKPNPASIHDMATAIGLVVAVLDGYRERGALAIDDSPAVATMIWAALHGVVQLFFAGHLGELTAARAIYERTVATIVGSLMVR